MKFDGTGLFGFLHPRRPAADLVAPARAAAAAPREVGERRAAAMRGLFPKISAWMARRSYLAAMSEVDRYLSQATDLFDLEQRIRQVERRGSASGWL
jgi:hypothetical protein